MLCVCELVFVLQPVAVRVERRLGKGRQQRRRGQSGKVLIHTSFIVLYY